jgi:hypothetical protein
MKFLVVKNQNVPDTVDEQFIKSKKFFEDRTPLKIDLEFVKIDFKDYTYNKLTEVNDYWTLSNIKTHIRQFVPLFQYEVVSFIYDLSGILVPGTAVNYRSFNPLWPDSEYVELVTRPEWIVTEDVLRVATHEWLHALHSRARRAGIHTVIDSMDLYDKEYDVFATDGNRARNIKELEPYWDFVIKNPVKDSLTLATTVKKNYKYFSAKEVDQNQLLPETWGLLDLARGFSDTPYVITKNGGRRTVASNIEAGGVPNSSHLRGYSADISASDGSKLIEFCKLIDRAVNITTSGKRYEILKSLFTTINFKNKGSSFKIISGALRAGFNRIGIYPRHLHLDHDPSLPSDVIWYG